MAETVHRRGDPNVAVFLTWFLPGSGHFYLGRWVSGLVWLFTGGLCGIGTIVDAVMLPRMVEDSNRGANGW